MKIIGSWLIVMAAAATGLKALDQVPTLLAGAPRGVRVFATVEDGERALGARIWMPGYYPDELAWPPARVEVALAHPAAVVVRLAGRPDGREERDRLVIVETIGVEAPPPPALLPEGQAMETTPVTIGSREGTLERVLVGTREVHDLWWNQDGRRVLLRYTGPVDRLLLIGASLARRADEGPR